MVFIGGPRQCGKTTLSLSFLKEEYSGTYLNWDRVSDRKKILNASWADQEELLVFDEIHKYKKWRNLIKGYYDTGEVLGDESQKLENLVATHLQKKLNFIEDFEGFKTRLHYVKDKNQKEVDFLVMIDGKIKELIEVKLTDESISPNLVHFANILQPEKAVQIVRAASKSWSKNKLILTDSVNYFTDIKF